MTDKKKFPYWLFVEESKTVKFSDLAHLIAKALHPSDAETYAYGAARVNLDEELPKAVANGTLRVRNPAGLGLHTFPIGDALQRAVMLPQFDLTQFLESRGIGLCLTPHGNGPIYWTLENVATAIQKQEDWHDGGRRSLLEKLEEASAQRCLVMRDPFDYLPVTTSEIRNYWELVTTTEINAWLDKQGAPYRLNVAAPAQTPATPAPVAVVALVEPDKSGPLPLTTSDIAFCFAGLKWSEEKWKKPLGDKPKWLQPCIAIPGVRGVSETRWNPVSIGAALVREEVKINSVRAKFQTIHLLTPWLEEWKTYEADNFST